MIRSKYDNITKCQGCKGPLFRYCDGSTGNSVIMCGYTKHVLVESKNGPLRWVKNDKQPCGWKVIIKA